jgi:hypothetical protein
MQLTHENYYSPEANLAYFSTSQIKTFAECPSRAMAELRGDYVRPESTALLVGSYVDAYFEGTLGQFMMAHPEVFKRDGTLKAEYIRANTMIERAEADPFFMEYMQGEKQVIRTGTIDGFPFKIKIDVLHPERIVDLKTARDFAPVYKPGEGRMSFVEAYGYTLQGAIYQAVEGHNKPFYINAITKEDNPDIAVIHIGQEYLDAEMKLLRQNLPFYDAVKQGIVEPPRCEHCAWCNATRKLTHPFTLDEFEMTFYEGE